LKKLKNKKF